MENVISSVRPLLLKALELFQKQGIPPTVSIDFGIKGGEETHLLLSLGYHVTAIDNVEDFLNELLLQERNQLYLSQLSTVRSNFEDLNWNTLEKVDLFVAFYSLSFIHPEVFLKVWSDIIQSIKPGGYFVGTLHTHHSTTKQIDGFFLEDPSYEHFMSKAQILELFKGFECEYFESESILYPETDYTSEKEGYSVIARKK